MADRAMEAIRGQVEAQWESPPEGLENAKELFVLIDREGGKGVGITLYEETEDDLRRGDEALNAMSPADPEATGRRTDVSVYRSSPAQGALSSLSQKITAGLRVGEGGEERRDRARDLRRGRPARRRGAFRGLRRGHRR